MFRKREDTGDGYSLIQGDALGVLTTLEDQSVDAVVVDPPYSSGGFTRSERSRDPVTKYTTGPQWNGQSFSGDNRDARSWSYWMNLWIGEAMRVMKEGAYFLCFSDWRQISYCIDAIQGGGIVLRGIIGWDKTGCARSPHTGYFRHQLEYIPWGTRGKCYKTQRGPWPGVYMCSVHGRRKHHVTGKPVGLMRQLVQCVEPGAVVLDPMSGSGSTGVGCILEGRKFVGIERDPHYYSVALKRLEEATGSECVPTT